MDDGLREAELARWIEVDPAHAEVTRWVYQHVPGARRAGVEAVTALEFYQRDTLAQTAGEPLFEHAAGVFWVRPLEPADSDGPGEVVYLRRHRRH